MLQSFLVPELAASSKQLLSMDLWTMFTLNKKILTLKKVNLYAENKFFHSI